MAIGNCACLSVNLNSDSKHPLKEIGVSHCLYFKNYLLPNL